MSLADRVRFLYACPLAWSALAGDDRVRRCATCAETVTNLSALSAAEAEAFLRAHPGAVCVRIERDAVGRVVHWPDVRAAAAAVAVLAAACAPPSGDTADSASPAPAATVTRPPAIGRAADTAPRPTSAPAETSPTQGPPTAGAAPETAPEAAPGAPGAAVTEEPGAVEELIDEVYDLLFPEPVMIGFIYSL
jgi:hypothetical protein